MEYRVERFTREANGGWRNGPLLLRFVNVNYTSGVAGLGTFGAPAAIGWDVSSSGDAGSQWILRTKKDTILGDNTVHAVARAIQTPSIRIGWNDRSTAGMLLPTAENLNPDDGYRHHGYCSNSGQRLRYKSVLSFRAAQGTSFDIQRMWQAGVKSTAGREGLLVWAGGKAGG